MVLTFCPKNVEGLKRATPKQLSQIEISPSGFGLDLPCSMPILTCRLWCLLAPQVFCFNPEASIAAILEHCSGNANICLQVHR